MPDLSPGYLGSFPLWRPAGLSRRALPAGTQLWRIDTQAPAIWDWSGFANPRHRFDPQSGGFRVRYASRSFVGTARERYRDSGMFIPADHAAHHLVKLVATRRLSVLDLRTERNLNVLALDDQINTSHHPRVWSSCHNLCDAIRRWWPDLDAIVYRSRTTPASSVNIAFFATAGFATESRALASRPDVLVDLVLRQGFTVDWDISSSRRGSVGPVGIEPTTEGL